MFSIFRKKYFQKPIKVFQIGCIGILLSSSFFVPTATSAAIANLPEFMQPNCTAQDCYFTFLAPINFPGFNIDEKGKTNVAKEGASRYLKGLYTFGIALASALALIMITVGGVQYASTDAITGKTAGKDRIMAALTGLVLALVSYTLLNTINSNLVSNNFSPNEINVGPPPASAGGAVEPVPPPIGVVGTPIAGAEGTGDPTGAILLGPNDQSVFGVADGDGYAGNYGDNGLGSYQFSPYPGWTYYNGGAHNSLKNPSEYSQGVANNTTKLAQDFGTVENAKNGAYEIFVNGKSIGAFPILDASAERFDMTYGLVKTHIDPTIKDSSANTWSAKGVTVAYKPLKDYWLTHERPKNPMVRDAFVSSNPSASEVDAQVRTPGNFQIR